MRRRGWQRPWASVAQDFPCRGPDSLCFSFLFWWQFGTFTPLQEWWFVSRCPQPVYRALDSFPPTLNSCELLSFLWSDGILHWDFFLGGVGWLVLPLTSPPQTQDAWFLFLYHFSQSLFTGKDDAFVLPGTPAQSTCTEVRAHLLPSMAFWLGIGSEEPGTPVHRRQCGRGHPPMILAQKPPAHLAQSCAVTA